MVTRIAITVFLVLGLAACVTTGIGGPKGPPMSGEAIRQALSGNTFNYTSPRGRGTVVYNADGTAFAKSATRQAKGQWSVKGNQYCVVFGNLEGRVTCHRLWKMGDGHYSIYRLNGMFGAELKRISESSRSS